MSFGIYEASLPIFLQGVNTLSHLLDKLEAFAAEQGRDAEAMLDLKLAPDMFDLRKQIQLACDFALNCAMKMAERDYQAVDFSEVTISDLRGLLARTREQLAQVNAADLVGSESRDIHLVFPWGEINFPGDKMVNYWSVPNFLFHVTTTYNLLRREGVAIGKADFLGQ